MLLPLAGTGELHAIAVSGSIRTEGLLDVPTFAEAGLPDVTYETWMGVAVAAGTSTPLIDRLNRELARAPGTKAAKAWFRNQGATVLSGTPAEFGKRIKNQGSLRAIRRGHPRRGHQGAISTKCGHLFTFMLQQTGKIDLVLIEIIRLQTGLKVCAMNCTDLEPQ